MEYTEENYNQFVSDLTEKLHEIGYETRENTIRKNGVVKQGICISKPGDNYGANLYPRGIFERFDGDADKAMEWFTSQEVNGTGMDSCAKFINLFNGDKQNLLDHIRLFLRSTNVIDDSEEEYHKTVLGDMDEYCKIIFSENGETLSSTVTRRMLKGYGYTISDEEIWEAARKNTFADEEFNIDSTINVLERMLLSQGAPAEVVESMKKDMQISGSGKMYVLSNKTKVQGAIQIMNKKKLAEWMRYMDIEKVAFIPSSLHEVILMDITDMEEFDENTLNSMISEINATQLPPEDVLSYKCHVLSYDKENDNVIRLL